MEKGQVIKANKKMFEERKKIVEKLKMIWIERKRKRLRKIKTKKKNKDFQKIVVITKKNKQKFKIDEHGLVKAKQ